MQNEDDWFKHYEEEEKKKKRQEILNSREYRIGKELLDYFIHNSQFNLFDDFWDILDNKHTKKFVKKTIDYFLDKYFEKLKEFKKKND